MDFLWKKVWAFLNEDNEVPKNLNDDPYGSALRLWKCFQDRISAPDELGKFRSTLSEPQMKSWIILDQWWNSQYHHDKPDIDEETVQFIKVAEKLQDEHVEHQDRRGYHVALSYLFVVEMVWYSQIYQLDGIPKARLPERAHQILQQMNDKVYLARRNAVKQAVWQKIGHSCYAEATNKEPVDGKRTLLGSTLDPCPWLGFNSTETLRKPAYLWDRKAQKSVKTIEITEGFPSFYCISHTWGRWRGEAAQIEGVDWAVPNNSRFEVLHLPEVFSRLDWPVQYIWFDLFCIPQDECPEQAQEIGKQAEIFRQAACNVLWMHDVFSWQIMQKTVMWLGLNYLHRANPTAAGIQEYLSNLGKQLDEESCVVGSERYLNPWAPVVESATASEDEVDFHEKNPGSWWFSSLWTLQEAYLCPSSLLADRNWELLDIGKTHLLTLDNLASLSYSPASDVTEPSSRPGAVEVLLFTMKRWELTDLSSPSRMSLLIAAESRRSTGPRAEAIMSALGATDWFESYRKQHSRAPPQKDVVFELYPLEFLQEVQKKLGGPFFLHHRSPTNTIEDAEAGEPLGTMLPLAFNSKYWQATQAMTFSTSGWQRSLSDDWLIQLDGSVIIREAAILNIEGDGSEPLAEGPVSISSPHGYRRFDSFRAWESELRQVPYRLAVPVVRYNYRQFGVILEGVGPTSPEGPLVLVKTEVFITLERWCQEDLIKVRPVHWRVL